MANPPKPAFQTDPVRLTALFLKNKEKLSGVQAEFFRRLIEGDPKGRINALNASDELRKLDQALGDKFDAVCTSFKDRKGTFEKMVGMIWESDLLHAQEQAGSYYSRGMRFILPVVLEEVEKEIGVRNFGAKGINEELRALFRESRPLFARFFGEYNGRQDVGALKEMIEMMNPGRASIVFWLIELKAREVKTAFDNYLFSVFAGSGYKSESKDMFSNPLTIMAMISNATVEFLANPLNKDAGIWDIAAQDQLHELNVFAEWVAAEKKK